MGATETEEGRSLAETPSWAVAAVITVLVTVGFSIHGGLKKCGKWLDRTKRKHLLAALDKIKEEVMVFGLLSLLMGHWIVFVSKICVKSSALSSRFYPCAPHSFPQHEVIIKDHAVVPKPLHLNSSVSRLLLEDVHRDSCPKGHEPFASYESLEQLHRFLFVLGTTHICYSFFAVALAMIKIYSWRTWEDLAKTLAFRGLLMVDTPAESENNGTDGVRMRRLASFLFHHTSHPWSQHRLLIWL
ncbi:MLO-like protein 4, partial [Striga hermonthica]